MTIEQELNALSSDLTALLPILQNIEQCGDGDFSNTNLLDNPNFTIDQREQGNGVIAGNSHFRDRWINFLGLSNNISTSADGTITLTQHVKQDFEVNIFEGQTVTVSAENLTVDMYVWVSGVQALLQVSAGRSSATLIGGSSGDVSIRAVTGSNSPYSFKNLKLEFGEVATPFIPPHPQVELAKCQRHYQIWGDETSNLHIGILYSNATLIVTEPLYLKKPMFSIPTIVVTDTTLRQFRTYAAGVFAVGTFNPFYGDGINGDYFKLRSDGGSGFPNLNTINAWISIQDYKIEAYTGL